MLTCGQAGQGWPRRSFQADSYAHPSLRRGPCGPKRRSSSRCALRALHVDPRRATALTGTCPGLPRNPPAAQAGVMQNIWGVSRIIRGRSVKDQVRLGNRKGQAKGQART